MHSGLSARKQRSIHGVTPEKIRVAFPMGRREFMRFSTPTGLRDRALIGVMDTFARVNAVIRMKVKDYFTPDRRGWVRLHEKAARSTRFPATTRWRNTSMKYATTTEIAADTEVRYSARTAQDRC
jgi:hypothetical protein